MQSGRLPLPVLRATLCEVERGLFHSNYRTDTAAADVHEMPRYILAGSTADAMRRIEKAARRCGFELVLWDDGAIAAASPGGREATGVGLAASTVAGD